MNRSLPVLTLFIGIGGVFGLDMQTAVGQSLTSIEDASDAVVTQAADPVQIIDIQTTFTATGLSLILVPESGQVSIPEAEIVENALVVNIPGAVLTLPDGDDFLILEPAEGIAAIQAVNLAADTVQLSITGVEAPPIADITTVGQTLQLSITPGNLPAPIVEEDALRVVVAEEELSPYVIPNATTGTRTDTPLRDVPQSIQVIPQAVLEDQQVLRFNDALRNISGVTTSQNDPREPTFTIRGFNFVSTLRDGFRLSFGGAGNIGVQELANVEQIEVLKGPASVLYGPAEPGGVINFVSEQPTRNPVYDLSLRVGNRGLVEPSLDFSGPLTEDGRVLYRLNALYRNEESFRDFDEDIERFFVNPVVSVALGDRTDLRLEFEYYEEDRPGDFGLIAFGDGVLDVPFDQSLGEPGDITKTTSLRTNYQFEHRFSDNWKIRNAFQYYRFDSEVIAALPAFLAFFDETTGILPRNFVKFDEPNDTFELQTNVVGEFSTGAVNHTLLFGVDFFRREEAAVTLLDFTPNPLDVFNPVFGQVPLPDFDALPVFFDSDTQTDLLGVYLQDQIEILDNLKLTAGLRFETFEQEVVNGPSFFFPGGSTSTQTGEAFTPRIGLVYQPVEPVSLFANFTRSFFPNTATTTSGEFLEPLRGEQFEVGVKAELLEGRLSAGLALFNINLENVATPDPNFPLQGSVASGKQRSRGVELDLIGEILPGWNVVANYALIDTEVIESNSGQEGNRLVSVPKNNFNLWTTYEIQEGAMEGLGFGLGINFVGRRFGDLDNSFELDSYVLTNAVVFYQRNNLRIGINARNLFDVDYIEGAVGTRFFDVYPGEDLTITGSIAVEL
ncbi:MAG: TonB-dependent siderophore receptor [Cyanobacteria bacterium P01_H01_bin.58]